MITQASAGLGNVAGLVYLAAFSLDVDESCASVQAPFPASMLAATVEPAPYDAPGAAGGPDLYISPGTTARSPRRLSSSWPNGWARPSRRSMARTAFVAQPVRAAQFILTALTPS